MQISLTGTKVYKRKRKHKSSPNNRERKGKKEKKLEKEKKILVKRVFGSFNHVLSSRHYCQQKDVVDIYIWERRQMQPATAALSLREMNTPSCHL